MNAYDENVNQFDFKYMQDNNIGGNENSYTLFDKSLQDDSDEGISFHDHQMVSANHKDQQKTRDMLSQRRLLSNQMRESIVK